MKREINLPDIAKAAIAVTLVSGIASFALEFDYLDEGRITAEKVLEIRNGSVVYTVNDGKNADERVSIPFNFFFEGLGFGKNPSIVFLDPSGAVSFADRCSVSPTTVATIHAAGNGSAYLKMEGPFVGYTHLEYNPYPRSKKFYAADGELLWEKDIVGYPRVSPIGDYVAIFEVETPDSKVTIIDREGRETVIRAPCGEWHAVSKDGEYVLLGEPSYVPTDWPGGTTVFSKEGVLKARLDPLFRCDTPFLNLAGQTLYGSDKLIIQSGVFGHRVVHPEQEFWALDKSPLFERGIQVYDGDGTKRWEKNLGRMSNPSLNFFVSDNGEFIAFFPGGNSGVSILKAKTGDRLYEFDPEIPDWIAEGFISDDGKTVLLTYVLGQRGEYKSGLGVFREGVVVAKVSAGPGDGRVTGRLSKDGTMLMVSELDSANVYLIGGRK